MAKRIVEIQVTESYVYPPELEGHTPEFGDNLLNTGFAGLKFGYDCVKKDTNESLQKKHEAELKRAQKEKDGIIEKNEKEAEKQRLEFEKNIQISKDREKMLEARLSDIQTVSSSNQSDMISKAKSEAELTYSGRIQEVQSKYDMAQAEIKALREEMDGKLEKLRTVKESREKDLLKEVSDARQDIIKQVNSAISREDTIRREAQTRHDEALKSVQTELDETKKCLEQLKLNRSNSSVKGNIFEGEVKECLEIAFGSEIEFLSKPKQLASGDHIIKVRGTIIMFEDKSKKRFDKDDARKADRDKLLHNEVAGLVILSCDASIEKTTHNFNIFYTDGRPTLNVPNFNSIQNKVQYLQHLVDIIEVINQNKITSSDEFQQMKLKYILRESLRFEAELRNNTNEAANYLKNIIESAEAVRKINQSSLRNYVTRIEEFSKDIASPIISHIEFEAKSPSATDSDDASSTETTLVPEIKTKVQNTCTPKISKPVRRVIQKKEETSIS
jgi:hypothetical protein